MSQTSSPRVAPLARRPLRSPQRLDLDTFARLANLHPDLVRRLVSLGLLDATTDAAGELWLAPTQLAAASRLQRLRNGLGLNYAALGVVVDLLDRITYLEATLQTSARFDAAWRVRSRPTGGQSWT
jgi:hypothetical protein